MVRSCCAVGCSNKASKGSNLSFHKIPSNPEKRKKWLTVIRRMDVTGKAAWTPTQYDTLCSDHFTQDDFYLSKHAQHKLLKDDAIPSKFYWTKDQKPCARKIRTVTDSVDKKVDNDSAVDVHVKFIDSEHTYSMGRSPSKIKRKFEETSSELAVVRKELAISKRREKYAKTTTANLLKEIKELRTISEQGTEMLESYKDIPVDLFSRPSHKYSDEQKLFSTTLYFYGPRAYNYVREKLNLPHPSTIRRWLSNIDSRPGFSVQVLNTLEEKLKKEPLIYNYCTIMIDAMSIRKQIEWDSKLQKMTGFVDLGSSSIDSDTCEAREALVVLAVGITGNWKIPLGYFLIDGISADVQCQLIITALCSLYDVGIRAVAVVMDGHPTNQKMASLLGCNLDPDNLQSYFQHPSKEDLNVYLFFDACHLIKNLRGALHCLQELSEESIGTARWSDISRLEKLQSVEGLRDANKLTPKHIDFHQQKMKVKLAVQTLSASVASALKFVSVTSEGFKNCQGTINFISMVDQLFDIFNSRTPAVKKGFKSPIRKSNLVKTEEFLLKTKCILLNLKDMAGKKVCTGKRKIAFIGFALNIDSLISLCHELLLESDQKLTLHYLLTYKLSQDHLELLFSAIRRYGGWNNNPSAAQFSSAYRSLLSHTGVIINESLSANCIPQDVTSILTIDSISNESNNSVLTFVDALYDHNNYTKYSVNSLSPFVDSVLEYIAGWVIRKISTRISCFECSSALVKPVSSNASGLLQIKNNGGLVVPSDDVVKIVQECEIVLRSTVHVKTVVSGEWEKVCVTKICSGLPTNLFKNLNDHFLNTCKDLENHYVVLVKPICSEFIRLRRFHAIRLGNIELEGKSIRHKLTKQILFHNQ